MIIVSTDGSCLRNPGGAIGWAWVNHTGPSNSGGEASGTNQIAELRALFEAIVAHPGDEPLLIESDSQYAIKCASEWLPGWKRKGWKTAGGSPVKNLDLVMNIDRAITERTGPVRFRWVRGHVGNHFNEAADALAGEAARAAAAGNSTAGNSTAGTSTAATSAAVAAARSTPALKANASDTRNDADLDEVATLF
ncbi:ribonuclease HI [Rhodococcus sp. BP-252]|uniref:ribonuclease H family protein n=1 Tax=unclassified Rhodococcus (in: high G+C Gram-positive bacteria) TaxID=192944 RepID=UPI001C9A9FA2|nr:MULTISPECIES: ribonuclease H [unclassified Rhodococcus (in: high G+C Gram-positive bacteria)]MBY6414729.1 ribonuclease HI [Rhodococcus sp. BP-320]MBY6419633.1 ribonuclease HI [Rhodococcus sp. BP-321]MBY6424592.1 ribonuclease HI [Rhodococcus sp. BP-324]MBY6429589.1 ribonuclease HI [Rhodococcus sp. BP-323]MBY6434579.1 ribonuclease HI [Rhodococcus sp. BP-322]